MIKGNRPPVIKNTAEAGGMSEHGLTLRRRFGGFGATLPSGSRRFDMSHFFQEVGVDRVGRWVGIKPSFRNYGLDNCKTGVWPGSSADGKGAVDVDDRGGGKS